MKCDMLHQVDDVKSIYVFLLLSLLQQSEFMETTELGMKSEIDTKKTDDSDCLNPHFHHLSH